MNPVEPEVSVGASDSLILAISISGFAILATTFYFVLIRPTASDSDNDEKDTSGAPSYDQLKRAKVTELNRAQRRARARTIAKEETKSSFGSKEERQRKQRDIELRERRAEQAEIDRHQKQQLQQAAKEKAQRNARKEQERTAQSLAELEHWETFIKSSAGYLSVEDLRQSFLKNRLLNLADISHQYKVSQSTISNRLKELVQDGRIAGIFTENNTRFVFFADGELRRIAQELETKQKLTYAELAGFCQQVLIEKPSSRATWTLSAKEGSG